MYKPIALVGRWCLAIPCIFLRNPKRFIEIYKGLKNGENWFSGIHIKDEFFAKYNNSVLSRIEMTALVLFKERWIDYTFHMS